MRKKKAPVRSTAGWAQRGHGAPGSRPVPGTGIHDEFDGPPAGALSFSEYRQGLEAAGFTDIEITPTHEVADSMHSAIVRAICSELAKK